MLRRSSGCRSNRAHQRRAAGRGTRVSRWPAQRRRGPPCAGSESFSWVRPGPIGTGGPRDRRSQGGRPTSASARSRVAAVQRQAATGRPRAASCTLRDQDGGAHYWRPQVAGPECVPDERTAPHLARSERWPPRGGRRVAKRAERRPQQARRWVSWGQLKMTPCRRTTTGAGLAGPTPTTGGARSTRGGRAERATAEGGGSARRKPTVA